MQYFKPEAANEFAGDCMPYAHGGRFHVFWLLDKNHHQERGGMGAHQWAHSSSPDLLEWTHHPLAVPIGEVGHYDGGSICTGSVFFHEGKHYAFFANRIPNGLGQNDESLSLATSEDSINFTKYAGNPIFYPKAPYLKLNFRDPHVFREDGKFHMLVSATQQDPALPNRAGCLAHLVSKDLLEWEQQPEPFIEGEADSSDPALPNAGTCPECSDYFRWGEWYYLLYSVYGLTHYRFSEQPFGPWRRPVVSTLESGHAYVMKTAAFSERRIAVAYVPSRGDDKDDGPLVYGGNMAFRELVQHEDGSLGTMWPTEMQPKIENEIPLAWLPSGKDVKSQGRELFLPRGVYAEARLGGVPQNAYLKMRVFPSVGHQPFGLSLRGDSEKQGYQLRFSPRDEVVELFHPQKLSVMYRLSDVTKLESPFDLEIVTYHDLIDILIDHERTLCVRLTEFRGSIFTFFTSGNEVHFSELQVSAYSPPRVPPYRSQ